MIYLNDYWLCGGWAQNQNYFKQNNLSRWKGLNPANNTLDVMTKVVLEGLTKWFGKVMAVDDVNLKVNGGEFFVVVGPTGCGKTTLLRLIAGLEKPDSGHIYFDDECVDQLKPAERCVRMVFQDYALWPHMKVFNERKYSNLSFAMRHRNYLTQDITNRADDVSHRVGIERKLYPRKPSQLSEGQKQKVAVGRALTIKAKMFLLDEPLGNLDPHDRKKAGSELKKIHRDFRTTTLHVTHNLIEAFDLADRMTVMKNGKLLQVGTPSMIYNTPVNSFVSDFIRSYDADVASVAERLG